MVSKCANLACSATFRYFHEGTLFHVAAEPGAPEEEGNHGTQRLERFWLCGECARKMTVVSNPAGILVVPLQLQSAHRKEGKPARVGLSLTHAGYVLWSEQEIRH